ncbi:MutS-like protein [Coelomomyces lativittatus]|nr:MutS-like protein [Coelomomyces lativittatus]
MVEHQASLFMRLDAHAIEALALLGEGPRKNTHLFGWLNKCITVGGSQLLNTWIRQPLLDPVALQLRLDRVELLCHLPTLLDSCRSFFKTLPNLSRLCKKLKRQRASLQDVVILYQTTLQLPELLPSLSIDALFQSFYLDCDQCFQNLVPFTTLVENVIDLEAVENHEFMIKPSHYAPLIELKNDIEALKAEVEPEMMQVANQLHAEPHKVLKLENNSQYGYHFRVSLTNAGLIRGKKFTELGTLKSGVLFTTPNLQLLSSKIQKVTLEYEAQQSVLVKEFMHKVEPHVPTFLVLNQLLNELDVLCAFAYVSQHAPIPYVKPIINENGPLELIQCRHPCVEVQESIEFIPNDLKMERSTSDFIIITGPNMGGKSTYIRQVGIIAIMAQIGCFVPCESATLPIFDGILCRIGASDHPVKGVSTFMAEMLETSSILRTATSRSLVIIDELGRGTSTHDGFGLAYAIAYHLVTEVKAFTLFATHFHELTKLSIELPSVQNYHVTAQTDEGALTLLYTVAPGSCDESFGIHAAKLAQLPPEVIHAAELKLMELEAPDKWKGEGLVGTLQDMEVGYTLVSKYLTEVQRIPIDMEDWREQLINLKYKYDNDVKQNPFLVSLLKQFSV